MSLWYQPPIYPYPHFPGFFPSRQSLADVRAQQQIDEQIQYVESAVLQLKFIILSNLKARRNTYCAISRLPVEVIVEVFMEANRCGGIDSEDPGHFELSCFRISGVCRSWRTIALDTPRLWSSIDMTSIHPDGCMEMLRRSKSVPLHIRYAPKTHSWFNIRGHDDAARWRVVMPQLGRVQTLEIATADQEHLIKVLHLNNYSLPFFPFRVEYVRATSLHVLRLTSQSGRLVLSKDIFPFEMPSLRILVLHGGTVGPTSPLLPSLTQLDIILPALGEQPLPQLLRFLQNAPSIETLSIEGRISAASDLTVSRITLSRLSRLKIVSSHFSSSAILDYLQRPTSTAIHFTCPPEDFADADLTSLKRTLLSHFAFGEPVTVSVDRVRITLSRDLDVEVAITTSRPGEHFAVWFPFSDDHMGDIITTLSRTIPLADASSLHLSGFAFEDEVDIPWGKVFQPFQGIKTLRFFQCDDKHMVAGLVKHNKSVDLPLPALREIHFEDCDGDEDDPSMELELDWDTMRSILSQRKDLGIHVQFYWDGFCFTDDVDEEL